MDRGSRLRILVLGYIVRGPVGGTTWPTLHHVVGLHRLGHEVWFLEDSEDYPSCYDPSRHVTDTDPSYGLAYTARVFERTGLPERWAYWDAHRVSWHGPAGPRALELCRTADLLLNVAAVHPIRPWLEQVPHRAFIDLDPVFEQVKQLTDPARRALAAQHDTFFTIGENIPSGCSRVPDDGLPWQRHRQPVVLDLWPVTPGRTDRPFTTVMLWDSYRAQTWNGVRYGMKSDSFGAFLDLPRRTRAALELALGSANAPRALLREHGWQVVDPLAPSADPWTFQRYLQDSAGEFALAKHGYVVAHSGWFSERSAGYLASARPVIVQDTGFGDFLPTGAGLFSFRDPDGAAAALEAVQSRYEHHCRAARALAGSHFESGRILTELLERALA